MGANRCVDEGRILVLSDLPDGNDLKEMSPVTLPTQKLDYARHQSEESRLDMDQVFNCGCIVAILIVVAIVAFVVIVLWIEGDLPVQH